MEKYKLLKNESIEFKGKTLYRIQALVSFGDVKAGDIGGYIESEDNLSHEGIAWVYDNAMVYENAKLLSTSVVYGNAEVFGNAIIYNNSKVYGNAEVYGNAKVFGDARVYDNARIYGNVAVYDSAKIYDDAEVYGDAKVYGEVEVYHFAKVYGDAKVDGNAKIIGNGEVSSDKDYIVFKNNWSSGRYFTYTFSNKMWEAGCFYGTGEELVKKAYKDSELSGKNYSLYVELVKNLEKNLQDMLSER